jgi:hypothetical protein
MCYNKRINSMKKEEWEKNVTLTPAQSALAKVLGATTRVAGHAINRVDEVLDGLKAVAVHCKKAADTTAKLGGKDGKHGVEHSVDRDQHQGLF